MSRAARKKKNTRRVGQYVEVEDELQRLIDLNLPIVAARHKINLEGITLKFRNNVNRRGELSETIRGTLKRYDTQYRQLWRFLALRGAWDSMLLLLFPIKTDQSPNCPAMDLDELNNFVRYKMNPSDMPLRAGNSDESRILTDIHGRTMVCAGGWKAGKTMDMFGTSLSSIHKTHLHKGDYTPSCQACQANETTIQEGCWPHKTTRKSLAWRKGNPAVADEFLTNKQTLEDPNYQAKVSTQIDPQDARNIRKATVGAIPTLGGLKFYTMVLLAIRMFLRADEVITIKTSSVPPELFHRVGGIVKAIGMSITGKTDKNKLRWFLLFLDDESPQLCGLRHFLIWIYFSGVNGEDSHLFPPDKDLHSDNNNGVYVAHESYSQFLNGLKTLAKNGVFDYDQQKDKKDREFRATIHIFRKGAYCFRIIASPTDTIDWVSLRYDARHEREGDVFIYVRDAATLRQTIDCASCPDMRCTDNRSVRFETKCAAAKIIGKSSDATGLTLQELAKEFVFSLGVGPEPAPRAVLEAAMKPRDNNIERKRQAFSESLSRNQQLMFSDLWNHMLSRQNEVINQHCQAVVTYEAQKRAAAEQQLQLTTSGPAKKKKKKNNNNNSQLVDLVFEDIDRNQVKNLLSIKEKMEAFQVLEGRLPEKDRDMTAGAKKWAIQSLRPALNCLRNHHNNNIDSYLDAWKGPGKWKMKHPCTGKNDSSCVALAASS